METKTIGRGVTLTAPKAIDMTLEEFVRGRFNREIDDLSSRTKLFISRLENYVVAMAPSAPKNAKTIGAVQKTYLDTLLGILNSESIESILNWEILLFFANKYSYTVFNERTLNQFYNQLPSHSTELFTLINALIIGTADNRVRKAFLRRFKLEAVIEKLPKKEQRENLAAFYLGAV